MDDVATGGSVTRSFTPMLREEMAESLVFYRRRLAEKIAIAMIRAAPHVFLNDNINPAAVAEDLANAITERLAARETGDPSGYNA